MSELTNDNRNFDRPVEIAAGTYWVGSNDSPWGLDCNPYLVVDNGEAVVIDAGSRPDFPSVMMKILQTGISPSAITALICQHYDPDLCAGIPNFEDIIGRHDLKIITDEANHLYIRQYGATSAVLSLEDLGYRFRMSSGRSLHFVNTPYVHSPGSFITLDMNTGVLFTSDLYGSFRRDQALLLRLRPECEHCNGDRECFQGPLGQNAKPHCPLYEIAQFHRRVMPSAKALRYALAQITKLGFHIIAPQHGCVIDRPEHIIAISEMLASLTGVGIDGVISEDLSTDLVDMDQLRKRLEEDGDRTIVQSALQPRKG